MDSETPKFEITTRDLTAGWDESKLDRVGPPIDVEQHDAGRPEAGRDTPSAAHTLTDLSKYYTFFTTGVLHATTPFDRDPVAEYVSQNPGNLPDESPVVIDSAQPFFEGLGVCLVVNNLVDLDRRLYAVAHTRWENLRDTILGIAMIDSRSGFFARTNFYELQLLDHFAMRKMAVIDKPPLVTINVFGVASTKHMAYLSPSASPLRPPRLWLGPPDTAVTVEGAEKLKTFGR